MKLQVPDLNNRGSADPRLCVELKTAKNGLAAKGPSKSGETDTARRARKENAGLPKRFWGR
jgi:hypothetical protein